MKYNKLITRAAKTSLLLIFLSFFACGNSQKKEKMTKTDTIQSEPFFKLSLAQWSFNKQIRSGEMSPLDFAQKASELGFEGIEYVSQLYTNELKKGDNPKEAMQTLLNTLKEKSESYGVYNLLIMVDGEGDLASIEENERDEAVEKHKKWVDAAAFLGCHSIRVNLFGTNDPEVWTQSAIDGLSKLAAYAETKHINVLVENHGWLSSDVPVLMNVIKTVGKSNCGTLPDFGNWCIKRPEGVRWGECLEEYPDKYEGVKLMMRAAKAVSAKSYDFDENGDETTIDYVRMLQIVKEVGYKGFIGVEYEGSRLSEEEGVVATKKLLLAASKKLN
ncbi:MAG: sugar phosphate isomerase/epimerase [Bacteroidetes bacterium]|nr:MAG: sugar phosphate isomerase/epimerase [Bacteroidota bacterium]